MLHLFSRFSLTLIDTLDTLVVSICIFFSLTGVYSAFISCLLDLQIFEWLICVCAFAFLGSEQAWWVWGCSEEGREGCTLGQRRGGVCVWDQHQSLRVFNRFDFCLVFSLNVHLGCQWNICNEIISTAGSWVAILWRICCVSVERGWSGIVMSS